MAEQVAKAEMLCRRPVGAAFNAFVHPETITGSWLESTTARWHPMLLRDL